MGHNIIIIHRKARRRRGRSFARRGTLKPLAMKQGPSTPSMKRFLFNLAIVLCSQTECGSASGALRQSHHRHSLRHSHDFRSVGAQTTNAVSITNRTLQETINGKAYTLLDSEEIYNWMVDLPSRYPDFVRLTTAQDAYGLPASGQNTDCPYDGNANGCLIHILTVQDYVKHPEGSDSSKRLPEVLLTGTLHGNERVGPTAVVEALDLMLEVALCESNQKNSLSKRFCDIDLEARGIDATHRQWLVRLLTTRRIVALPIANAVGYYRNTREEDGIDANRDFPYDIIDPTQCMQTIAARALNEVVREHMFQMALVFHAGVKVLGYEWGADSWNKVAAPDDVSQNLIAAAHSSFGGGWAGETAYPYGPMYSTVYTVRGGMEDWAYAASWDANRVIQCQPTTYSGYPASKTIYSNSSHRIFNMLVETSDAKTPQSNLGSSGDLFNPNSAGNGHVPRNIRLSLIATDIVEPYVRITNTGGILVDDGIIPLKQSQDSQSCREKPVLEIDTNSDPVVVSWNVGGALQVDESTLWLGRWDELGAGTLNCFSQPSVADIEALRQGSVVLSSSSGLGNTASNGKGTTFAAALDPSTMSQGGEFYILASARVDQSWRDPPDGVQPPVPPQTHLANVRTNPSWYHESERNIVQGRLDWFSIPVTIVVAVANSVTDNPTESPYTESPISVPSSVPSVVPVKESKVPKEPQKSSSSPSFAPSNPLTDPPSDYPTDIPTLVPSPTPSRLPSQVPVGTENVFGRPGAEQDTNSTAPFSEEIDILLRGLELLLNGTEQEYFEEALTAFLKKGDKTASVDVLHQQLITRKPSRRLQQKDAPQSIDLQVTTLVSSWMDDTPGLTAARSIRQNNTGILAELLALDADVFGSVEEIHPYALSTQPPLPPVATSPPPVTIITQAPTISAAPVLVQQDAPGMASSTSDGINFSVYLVPIALFLVITVGATIYYKHRLTRLRRFRDQTKEIVGNNQYNDGSMSSAEKESGEDWFWDEAKLEDSH